MSKVYFIGDTHFGHAGITKFRREFPTEEVHRHFLRDEWNKVVTKRDKVFVLGDAAFTPQGLKTFGEMNGEKVLIRGNHDTLTTREYLKYFKEVHGALPYKGLILTHIPIHPAELYRWRNVHGHCHRGGPDGRSYYNVCCDFTAYRPVLHETIVDRLNVRAWREDEARQQMQEHLKQELEKKHGKRGTTGVPDEAGTGDIPKG